MKLLFDQNLSPRLATQLADLFPASSHVNLQGLGEQTDAVVWEFAAENEFTIVSKDTDFVDYSATLGFPPHVILIQTGNCTTAKVEALLRSNQPSINELKEAGTAGLLALY